MGTDMIAAILPTLIELRRGAAGGKNLCATFSLEGDGDVWVQITSFEINLAFPFADDPADRLPSAVFRAVGGVELLDWEAKNFATYSYPQEVSAQALAETVDHIFVEVLGQNVGGYAVTVERVDLD